jgi:hypothetical protein
MAANVSEADIHKQAVSFPTAGGMLESIALAALRSITSSNLVGACIGRSAGFSPSIFGLRSLPRGDVRDHEGEAQKAISRKDGVLYP